MSTPKIQVVTITPTGASPDSVTIYPEDGDEVKWVGPSKWTVDFGSDSPFEGHSFHEGQPQSGKAKGNAPLKSYQYTVTVNDKVNDPTVILQGGSRG